MPTPKSKRGQSPSSKPSRASALRADSTPAVDAFMATLEHPMKSEIESLRTIILGADSSIAEGIKWKAPSFRTTEYFATVNLRSKVGVGLILHLGAKVRRLPAGGITIKDPTGLLNSLGKDRAMIDFASAAEIKRHKAALQSVVRQWLTAV